MNKLLKKEQIRFDEIDFLKGLAIITMIISHIFYFKKNLDMGSTLNYNSYWYLFLTLFAEIVFICCIGINLSLSYQKYKRDCHKKKTCTNNYYIRQIKRVCIIAVFALILSYLTYLTHDYKFIKFGILHFASLAIFILMWTVQYNFVNVFYIIVISLIYFLKKYLINISYNYLNPFVIFIIGIFNPQYYSLDYFPLVPWLLFSCFGILIGNIFYRKYQRRFSINKKIIKFISNPKNIFTSVIRLLGKYSFFVYLIHIPILYFILILYKKYYL